MLADIFNSRLFEVTSLTAAINDQPFVPGVLGTIFEEDGVETTSVFVEKKGNVLELVQSSERGTPGSAIETGKRQGIDFRAVRLLVPGSLMADEVQNVRAFGSEDQLQGVEEKRDEKLALAGQSLDLTLEYHRLGAIQGKVLDKDNSVIFDLYDKFDIAEPAAIDFDLSAAASHLRKKCFQARVVINEALGASRALVRGVRVFCGNTFWEDLLENEEVNRTYLNQQAANELREGDVRDAFKFGGFIWENYEGAGAVAIPTDECRIVPIGIPGFLKTTYVPADYVEAVNTKGLPRYAKAELMKFGRGIELESQANPITICTRPGALIKGTRT